MQDSTPRAFFDANVLLYLATDEEAKAMVAERLLDVGGTVSVQTLNEITNVMQRKFRLPWEPIVDLVGRLSSLLIVVPVTMDVHSDGLRIAQRYRLSVFDSMIVAAALAADCTVLYSEDMHNGLVVDRRLTIRNPFLH